MEVDWLCRQIIRFSSPKMIVVRKGIVNKKLVEIINGIIKCNI